MAGKGGRRAGAGRKPGVPNKITTALREAILAAADEAHPDGRVGYLKWLANNNSGAFAGLLGKVLPTELTGAVDLNLSHEERLERLK